MQEDFQSTLSPTRSSSVSLDSDQTVSDLLPELQEKLKLLTDGMNESLAENAALDEEMSAVLKDLGLDLNSLPIDIREDLDKVCDILKAEGLIDMNLTSLEIRKQQKETEARMKARAEAEFKLNYEEALRMEKRLQEKLDIVKKSVDSLESKFQAMHEDYKDEESERLLILSKLNTYKDTVMKMEKQLEELQVADFHPDIILKKSQVCMEKLRELAELDEYLSQYGELPPNLLQAKAVLESKKKELENIDRMIMERLQ